MCFAQGESVDGEQEAEGLANASEAPAKDCTKSSNSMESLFSLQSSQSSSSSKRRTQMSTSLPYIMLHFSVTWDFSHCGAE